MEVAILLIVFSFVASFTDAWTAVTRREQLWGFLRENRQGQQFTTGEDFLTLRNCQNGWVSSEEPFLVSAALCQTRETFEVTFLSGNLIALRTAHGNYISGHPDGVLNTTAPNIGDSEKWTMLIDSHGETLAFRSYYGLYMCWDLYQMKMTADRKHLREWEMFTGWKKGPKSLWQPTDGWHEVFTFDNRNVTTAAAIPYTLYVGLSQTTARPYTTSTSIDVEAGEMLPWQFCSAIQSTTGHSWKTSNLEIWRDMVSSEATFNVPPGRKLTLFQTKGKMGPFHVFTRVFKFK